MMPQNSNRGRRSVSNGLTESFEDQARDSMTNFVLGRDVAGSILPPLGRNHAYQLHVVPPSRYGVAAAVLEGAGRQSGTYIDLAMTISRIAQVIVSYGCDACEVIDNVDSGDANTPQTLRIPPGSWSRQGRNLVHFIPEVSPAEAGPLIVPEGQYVIIEMKRLPARYWQELVLTLAQVDRGIMRQMTLSAAGKINVLDRIELRDAALLRATRDIGWTGGLSNLTHGYFNYRTLLFRRFIAELRRDIVDRLNEMLRIVGRRAGFEAYLKVLGLASVEQFDEALERFAEGRLSWPAVKELQ